MQDQQCVCRRADPPPVSEQTLATAKALAGLTDSEHD